VGIKNYAKNAKKCCEKKVIFEFVALRMKVSGSGFRGLAETVLLNLNV
jgi:hypothetical protein